jgi:UDP-glucuronate decarboxylase
MRPNDGRVIPTFLTQALGDDLTVYGDGSQTRSFCFIDDLVEGFRSMMDSRGLEREVINLGWENEVTIKSLVQKTLDFVETRQ